VQLISRLLHAATIRVENEITHNQGRIGGTGATFRRRIAALMRAVSTPI
jgi:hypothetical protein